MSSTKRSRCSPSSTPGPCESAVKRHRPNRSTPILRLSDELFLRICHGLSPTDLASFQLVSHRCSRIAVDGHIWKALYYRRFVLPRVLRIRGLGREQVGDYASRMSRWLDDGKLAQAEGTNWKARYKLRHNWTHGSCELWKINVACADEAKEDSVGERSHGIVIAASKTRGLWAMRIHNTNEIIARMPLYSQSLPFSCAGPPTAMAIDEESGGESGLVNVTVGFENGSFAMYQLDMTGKISGFRTRYIHKLSGKRSATGCYAMASLGPFLAMMRGQTWDIYEFETSANPHFRNSPSSVSRMTILRPPILLQSLCSSTVWLPLVLSLRRSLNDTMLASVVYSCALLDGWSVGIQQLRFKIHGNLSKRPTIGKRLDHRTAVLEESRIATAVQPGFTSLLGNAGEEGLGTYSTSGATWGNTNPGMSLGHNGSQTQFDPPLAQATSVSYHHPYLVTSHRDNTLTLYMVHSTTSSLKIEPGQRLHGHTSGVTQVIVDCRGKAISINRNGSEIRVWELEGGVSRKSRGGASVRIEPVVRRHHHPDSNHCNTSATTTTMPTHLGILCGFDESQIIVLQEPEPEPKPIQRQQKEEETYPTNVGESHTTSIHRPFPRLLVYDFTR
ncbi:hypothetical protein BZA77DRAFT_242628 [Pyronema omphalodes]|nr:hypothetical protein BZA77DRAFT_242628 [Pyronema omphalodes]